MEGIAATGVKAGTLRHWTHVCTCTCTYIITNSHTHICTHSCTHTCTHHRTIMHSPCTYTIKISNLSPIHPLFFVFQFSFTLTSSQTLLVICHGSISEMAMHFLDKFSLMVIKIQSKFELRRMCGALGATAVMRLGPCSPEEMGECSL